LLIKMRQWIKVHISVVRMAQSVALNVKGLVIL
jgi:hypothetical protein